MGDIAMTSSYYKTLYFCHSLLVEIQTKSVQVNKILHLIFLSPFKYSSFYNTSEIKGMQERMYKAEKKKNSTVKCTL